MSTASRFALVMLCIVGEYASAEDAQSLNSKIAQAWKKAGHDFAVVEAWHKAGAEIGWYGPNPHGFQGFEEKRHQNSWPAFWCYSEFDLALAKMPEPKAPFALHLGIGFHVVQIRLRVIDAVLQRLRVIRGLRMNLLEMHEDRVGWRRAL